MSIKYTRIRSLKTLGALGAILLISAPMSFGASRLIDAVKKQDTAAVKTLLAQKADLNATETDGSTALHWAASKDNAELVGMLLDAGANPKTETRYKITPMSLACENGNVAMIDRFLKAGVDANATSGEGQTALMTASLNGKVEAIKLLLAKGAKVDTIEPYRGQTALMWAAGEGNAEATAMLIEFGSSVKAKSKAGFTPFLFAVRNRRIDAAKVLLDHGANVEDTTPDGTTALNVAIVNGFFDMASVLLDYKANPNATDPNGSALHSVAWLRRPGTTWEATALAEDPIAAPRPSGNVTAIDLAKKLLEHGANPNAKIEWKETRFQVGLGTTRNPPNVPLGRHYLTFNGTTPFWQAARNGDPALMKLLVEHGADPNIPSINNVTPLMVAAGLDYYEGETPGPFSGVSEADRLAAVKLCVQFGNDVNAKTNLGNYKMVWEQSNLNMTKYPDNIGDLSGLGVGDPRFNETTALFGAVISNQPSIVQYLVDQGATLDTKNAAGWTPLSITKGFFLANAHKTFPAAEQIITKAMVAKGMKPE